MRRGRLAQFVLMWCLARHRTSKPLRVKTLRRSSICTHTNRAITTRGDAEETQGSNATSTVRTINLTGEAQAGDERVASPKTRGAFEV